MDGRTRPSPKRQPTYTVFAKPQMLPALAQEKLNGGERAAAAGFSATNVRRLAAGPQLHRDTRGPGQAVAREHAGASRSERQNCRLGEPHGDAPLRGNERGEYRTAARLVVAEVVSAPSRFTRLKRNEWCRSQDEGAWCLVENRELASPLEDFSMPGIKVDNRDAITAVAVRLQSRDDLREDRRSERIMEVAHKI